MHKKHRLKAPLIAVLGFVALLSIAAPASAASVDPVFHEGNPQCEDLGLASIHKFDNLNGNEDTLSSSGITVTFNGDATFDFTSVDPIGAVIVKGGDNSNVYSYTTLTFADQGLHAPDNPSSGSFFGLSHIEFCRPLPKPSILVEKVAVASPIPAGDVAQFTIKVTNTGNVTLTGYSFSDPRCDGGNATQTGGDTDTTLEVGQVRTYSCSVDTAPTDTADVVNKSFCAGGNSGETPVSMCAEATVKLTPPTTRTTTPTTPTTTPTTPGAGGGVLPETIASGQARLRGPSGCVKQAFRARVSGRSIASVSFFVDGKLVKKITGARATYSISVKPGRFGFGRHRIVAQVSFVEGSGTATRTLRLTFRRCAKGAVAPRFTG